MTTRTILAAQWGNEAQTSVNLQTVEAAAVSVSLLDNPAYFGGWREAFNEWQDAGNPVDEFPEE